MVDVGASASPAGSPSPKRACIFPPRLRDLQREALRSPKGPVIDTAIIAGTMAVKRTHELIPFCHPLAIERCRIEAHFETPQVLVLRCEVGVEHRSGVEMEALTGASVAALTVYDMCKALSHEIVIAISVSSPSAVVGTVGPDRKAMKYRLLYFASRPTEQVAIAKPSTVRRPTRCAVCRDRRTPRLLFARERLRVAVNGAFAGWAHALADGDEVVFLPPVSGG